ncbi:MAG: CvpA family protein [Segetibacter sp.]|nr:CvpA family protein [Segetibacter sp.]
MFIDIIFIVLIVMALFKGYTRGLIIAIFSLFAFIIGLAAALKLSAVVAQKLQDKINVGGYFLPIISFAIVFIAVVFIVNAAAGLLRKAVRLAFLGWLDSFGGILLYAVIYLMVFSVILFYSTKINLISPEMQSASVTYSFVAPWGPKVIDWLGKLLPFFSNLFSDLSRFFEGVSHKTNTEPV